MSLAYWTAAGFEIVGYHRPEGVQNIYEETEESARDLARRAAARALRAGDCSADTLDGCARARHAAFADKASPPFCVWCRPKPR